MREFLEKAQNAKERGEASEAALFLARAEEADHFRRKATTAAVQRIVANQTTSDSVHLHNLHVDEATAVAESALVAFRLDGARFLDIITGRGWHSRSGSRIKPAVIDLTRNKITFSFINDGALRVYFR